ncbi:MAG: hypothetical protein WC742_03890 [Gallionellaceae bacterium]|jgi:hypothetical protein
METNQSVSLQTVLIRKMQSAEGHTPCYATMASNECVNNDCCWRHDCFDDDVDMSLQQIAFAK